MWTLRSYNSLHLPRMFIFSSIGHAIFITAIVIGVGLPFSETKPTPIIAIGAPGAPIIVHVGDPIKAPGVIRTIKVENGNLPKPPAPAAKTPKPATRTLPAATPIPIQSPLKPVEPITRPAKVIPKPVESKEFKTTPAPASTPALAKIAESAADANGLKQLPAASSLPSDLIPSLPSIDAAISAPNGTGTGKGPMAKGFTDGAQTGGLGTSLETDEGVKIPGADLAKAQLLLGQNFIYPNYLNNRPLKTCVIEFQWLNDGRIQNARIRMSTGNPSLDQYALSAVNNTQAFPPLKPYTNLAVVTATVPFQFGEAARQ